MFSLQEIQLEDHQGNHPAILLFFRLKYPLLVQLADRVANPVEDRVANQQVILVAYRLENLQCSPPGSLLSNRQGIRLVSHLKNLRGNPQVSQLENLLASQPDSLLWNQLLVRVGNQLGSHRWNQLVNHL